MTGKTQLLDLIKALIFDLDGTLYVNDDLGREINLSACRYLADRKSISLAEATVLLKKTRADLAISAGAEATLSHACLALGGDIVEMHRRFAAEINAEAFLGRDERVVDLLRYLGSKAELHIYTNNNRSLSTRIMDALGISGLFLQVFTIEDTWRPKPDRKTLTNIFRQIGRKPEECLFVGDRYDVDLRLPAEMGCAVFPVKCIEDLLQLRLHIGEKNMLSDKKATLDAIMRAMEIEKETFDFYVKSEQKTFDPNGKRIFRWLAKSEEVHYLKLTELYNALNQGERWVFYAGSTIELEPEGDNARQVTFDTSDLEALEIAMDIEKKGMAYFADLIEKTSDPAGKDMLTTLYNEEKEHLRVITEKYNELK